jgi:hypothetical protein
MARRQVREGEQYLMVFPAPYGFPSEGKWHAGAPEE